jgi:hypothetical protein
MTDTIPTLEECGIVAGSFKAEEGSLVAVNLDSLLVAIADSMTDDDCKLVAHRCNTFDRLLDACEYTLRFVNEYDVDEKFHPSLRQKLEAAVTAAKKGATS